MMVGEDDKKQRKLTFSQREGKAPLPEALQTGKLTKKFRNQVWFVIENSIGNASHCPFFDVVFDNASTEGKYWRKFFSLYLLDVQNIPHDEGEIFKPSEVIQQLKYIIIDSEVHEALTVLEYMLRLSTTPKKLANNIEACFEFAPYLIDRSSKPVCIVPTTSEEMKASVKRSLDNIGKSDLIGAKSHLRNAGQELNNNNFANSVRESISAAESAARQIAPKQPKDFRVALDSLTKMGIIKHTQLKEAFEKLYAYTNAEKGIRHALSDTDKANVGFDEAIFMYGACVSFVDYLASKKNR